MLVKRSEMLEAEKGRIHLQSIEAKYLGREKRTDFFFFFLFFHLF